MPRDFSGYFGSDITSPATKSRLTTPGARLEPTFPARAFVVMSAGDVVIRLPDDSGDVAFSGVTPSLAIIPICVEVVQAASTASLLLLW